MPDVMLVGHCGPDAIMLKTVVQRALPEASVELINDHDALDASLTGDVVLLVNRELDGDFRTGTGGIDLIRHLTESGATAPMLLVSNFEDAQAQAEAVLENGQRVAHPPPRGHALDTHAPSAIWLDTCRTCRTRRYARENRRKARTSLGS